MLDTPPARLFPWRAALAVAITVVTWASAFAGIRAALKDYSPESVALLRYLTASLLLVGVTIARRLPLSRREDWLPLIGLGFAGFTFYNVALNAGSVRLPAGNASLIIASAPVFVALLASALNGERLGRARWLGIGLSLLGVSLIAVDPRAGVRLSPSALLVLAAALAQAVYTVAHKPLLKRYPPLALTTYAVWAGTLLLLVFTPRLMAEARQAAWPATAAVLYMGIFPGAIGYVSWAYALQQLPASRAGSFLYLVPAVAILIAWVWLGEVPTARAVAGGVLVLVGVMVVNWRRSVPGAAKGEEGVTMPPAR